jgi:PAS domain S-box-containing protein
VRAAPRALAEVLADGPLPIGRFFELAIACADALAALHRGELVHGRLHPGTILVDERSGTALLGQPDRNFAKGIAPPGRITPADAPYLSPEQTGRVAVPCDERSDLYALGTVFYEMLTGAPPFVSDDPLELVHAHLARQPVAPHELASRVPSIVSAILLKLLAKAPADRYQSAAGLQSDLERAAAGSDEAFVLGEHDVPRQLQLPEQLYGRTEAVIELLAAFERVSGGATELLLISGSAGSGKTRLVQEVQRPILQRLGYFALGRAAPDTSAVPYASLGQALRHLADRLLTESEASVAQWRTTFADMLGDHADDLIAVAPEFALLVEPRPRSASGPSPTPERFRVALERTLQTVTAAGQPLVLALDDLQWVDAETLEVLRHLAAQPAFRYVLLIGTYRSEAMYPTHPFMRSVEAIEASGARPAHIGLGPLDAPTLEQFVAAALRAEAATVRPLAAELHQRSGGNPGFARQLLEWLYASGRIRRDEIMRAWQFDLPLLKQLDWPLHGQALGAQRVPKSDTALPRRTEEAITSTPVALADDPLDVVVIVQAAQALSSETDLLGLLRTLMRVALEAAGATQGSLLLKRDDEWRVEASASADGQVRLLPSVPLQWATDLSFAAVHYVRRTGEALIVEDATVDPRFAHDPHVLAVRPRSIFCLPIVSRSKLIGILYLENWLTRAAFTPRHRHVMTLLSAQMAISIENARLYDAMRGEIAERTRAEAQVREQAMLLDLANDAILVLDPDDRIRYWNQGAEKLYGWTAAEAIGQTGPALLGTDSENAASRTRHVQTSGSWRGEPVHRNKAGERLLIQASATRIDDENGVPKGTLVIHTDLTEHKRIEAHLLRVQRMQSIGTLAGGIAHDLNNILTPVLMAVDTLRARVREEPLLDLLDMIRSNVERGADIVGQLLTFARGAGGKRSSLEPQTLVRDLERIVHETFPRSIRLELRVARDVARISADPTQVHQVLLNLALNARDAMADGGTLTIAAANVRFDQADVRTYPEARTGQFVEFAVTDTGTGIAPELLDKVFEPFFTTKQAGSGTGLGLASVAGIVKGHDGFVRIESTVGVGTTVRVYLPAIAASVTETGAAPAKAAGGRGELILLVDDEAPILRATKDMLEANGYTVLVASDGAAALAQYAQHSAHIRAIVTDVMMPKVGGATMVRELVARGARVPIIVTSGVPLRPETADAALLAEYPFLQKPYTAAQLLEVIGAALAASVEPRAS